MTSTDQRAAPPTRCIACHTVADIGIRTTKGVPLATGGSKKSFHQSLRETDCMACYTDHTDHTGPALTRRVSKSFSHALPL